MERTQFEYTYAIKYMHTYAVSGHTHSLGQSIERFYRQQDTQCPDCVSKYRSAQMNGNG